MALTNPFPGKLTALPLHHDHNRYRRTGENIGHGAVLRRAGVAAARLPANSPRLGWMVSTGQGGEDWLVLMAFSLWF